MNDTLRVLLADDDADDRTFFKEALKEVPVPTSFETVYDGELLMNYLEQNIEELPDILFLDLNMPRKNGFECLAEIKKNEKLRDLPLIIYSTSEPPGDYKQDTVNMLFKFDGHYYAKKPYDFKELIKMLHGALAIVAMRKQADEII